MRKKADATNTRYLEFYMKCWRLISMGSRKNTNPIRYWIIYMLIMVTNTVLVTLMYKHFFIHARDIDGVAEIVDFGTLFTAGLFRFIHAYIYRRKYDELVEFIHNNFIHESFGDGKKLTMQRYVKISKIVSYSYMILTIFWVIQITSTPVLTNLISQKKKEPITVFHVDMPYDESTYIGTALTYIIHFISYNSMALIYCFGDAYWFVILMLTTAQFELISHSIRSLADPQEEDENQQKVDVETEYVEKILVTCFNHHQVMRRCVRKIEDLLNHIVLVDFLHAITSITFILFDMTLAINQQNTVKAINLLGFFLLSVSHMWILDYFGNRVTTKEEDISKAIYEVPWNNYPKKLRTAVIIMMILASHPHKLTGGKLFSLSLEFYGKSMRTILSYFTVLLQMRGT